MVDRLLSQGYIALWLEKSFQKFYGRYQDLVNKYPRSVKKIVNDSFLGLSLFDISQDSSRFLLLLYMDLSLGYFDTLSNCQL